MEYAEYPNRGDFLECKNCHVEVLLVDPRLKERRRRLIAFVEEHLHKCYRSQ